jgi:hypothetical protein
MHRQQLPASTFPQNQHTNVAWCCQVVSLLGDIMSHYLVIMLHRVPHQQLLLVRSAGITPVAAFIIPPSPPTPQATCHTPPFTSCLSMVVVAHTSHPQAPYPPPSSPAKLPHLLAALTAAYRLSQQLLSLYRGPNNICSLWSLLAAWRSAVAPLPQPQHANHVIPHPLQVSRARFKQHTHLPPTSSISPPPHTHTSTLHTSALLPHLLAALIATYRSSQQLLSLYRLPLPS